MESIHRSTKDLIAQWFAAGISSPAGLAFVADDFVWFGPPSMGELFEDSEASAQRGKDGLARLEYIDRAVYADYEPGAMEDRTNVRFLISEGDIAVTEFEAEFTTHDGLNYHNIYCLVIRVRDGLIAEVREHADTHYFWEAQLNTEEKRAAVQRRLYELRTHSRSEC